MAARAIPSTSPRDTGTLFRRFARPRHTPASVPPPELPTPVPRCAQAKIRSSLEGNKSAEASSGATLSSSRGSSRDHRASGVAPLLLLQRGRVRPRSSPVCRQLRVHVGEYPTNREPAHRPEVRDVHKPAELPSPLRDCCGCSAGSMKLWITRTSHAVQPKAEYSHAAVLRYRLSLSDFSIENFVIW